LSAFKENIGREFALGGHPVVGTVLKNILHLRSDQLGILAENLGPVQIRESIGELLRSNHILNPEEGIIVFGKANAIRLQLPGEPFMAV